MYVPFNQLSDKARIWVYQANRPLERKETTAILQRTKAFLEAWTSHDHPLQCSAEILYDQFLILGVEESVQEAGCCAFDASVRFLREVEQDFQVDLLNRTHIAFRRDETTFVTSFEQLQVNIQQGIISADMLTFDNTITTKRELADKWLIPAKDSWVGRYFNA